MIKKLILMAILFTLFLVAPTSSNVNVDLRVNQTDALYIRGIVVEDSTGRGVGATWGLVLNGTLDTLIWTDLAGISSWNWADSSGEPPFWVVKKIRLEVD